jgi:lipopolysaccharide transport system ATP-binding protein
MSDTVIRVENLGKRYKLGLVHHDRLADLITSGIHRVGTGLHSLFSRDGQRPNNDSQLTIHDPRLINKSRITNNKSPSDDYIWALRNVSFEVKQGEVVGIIGRNGAGKSTLLKILTGVTEPTEGRAWLNGRVGSLLEVGTGFHPELTGRENVFLNGAILGMTKAEIKNKFDEIVDFAEIERFIDTPVKRYSSGMYVRLAFAVAAHLEPEILLVDEVLAVGDVSFQKKCLGKMGDVASRGRTVLFVSHNMAAIENLCSRSILVAHGQIAIDGSTQDVIGAYLKSTQELADFNLAERHDRRGEGAIQFKAVELLNDRYEPVGFPRTGDKLIIRLHYEAKPEDEFKNCRVSVTVKGNAKTYFLTSTELVSDTELILRGQSYLDCIIEELPLSKGQYYLNLFMETNKVIQDWVEAAVRFSVVDGNFYGTGRNYPPGWEGQTVLVKHSWQWRMH